jgi:hypothetical protein
LSPQSEARIRCATWNRAQHADPVGTIGSYRSFLLIEWPLPWPKDVAEILPPDLTSELRASKCRIQGLVPEDSDSPRRVVFYQGGCDGLFARFLRSEVTVDATDVVDAVRQLTAGRGPQPAEATGADVLVCTHGGRDRCCGALGTRLAIDLFSDPTALGTTTRVWRTSHTGGHRFAPTALVFPKGTGWAFADTALVRNVVAGEGEISDVLGFYRGCVGLNSPRIQAVERAVLGEMGWDLFDMRRRGWEKSDGGVRLDVELPTAQIVTREAVVRDGGSSICRNVANRSVSTEGPRRSLPLSRSVCPRRQRLVRSRRGRRHDES